MSDAPPPGSAGSYYPPTGTYPSPAEAPAVAGFGPVAAQPPQKTRRLGLLTMGFCLVAAGVVLLLAAFLPNLDYAFIARLSPVVLVLLGIEVLVGTVRHKGERLRVDFLSVVLCMLLIGGSLMATAGATYYYNHVEGRRVETRLEAELEAASHAALAAAGAPKVTGLEWHVGLNDTGVPAATPADLRVEHTVQLRVTLGADYTGKAAFAKDSETVLRLLRPLVSHLDYVSFHNYDPRRDDATGGRPEVQYTLWLDGQHQVDAPDLRLEELVEESRREPDPAEGH